MASPRVDLLLANLDELLETGSRRDVDDLLSALKSRVDKEVAPPKLPDVALPFGGRDAVSVHEAAPYLFCCAESVRRLIREGKLEVVRKGRGRNYLVLVSSLVRYRQAMMAHGNPQVEQEA